MAIVDAHHHFWHPARGDYGWIPPDDPILSRAYGPGDLVQTLTDVGVTRTVLVQAAPTVWETEYLLGIADTSSVFAKVVGWIDFENPAERATLERLAGHPKFSGVRPMIQNLPDPDWMLRDDIQWAFQAIVDLDLTLDCLGFPLHLDNFHKLLTRYPDMRAVIDHCMKPQIRDGANALPAWADGMMRLAEDTNAFCKLSGLVTEADADSSVPVLRPYVDHVIGAFGPNRVMWGSDWPVARLRLEYEDWFARCQSLTAGLTREDRRAIFNDTASLFYRIA